MACEIKYKQWAEKIIFDCLSVQNEKIIVSEKQVPFKSILGLLNHIYRIDCIWQCHLLGKENTFETKIPNPLISFEELKQLQFKMNDWLVSYFNRENGINFNEKVNFQFVNGDKGCMTRYEMVQHLVNHSTYHRGHIGSILNSLGLNTPTTDYPVFLSENRE